MRAWELLAINLKSHGKMDKMLCFGIYTKDLNGVTRIRKERQEYPNKRFDEAIDEKLPTVIKMRAVSKDA